MTPTITHYRDDDISTLSLEQIQTLSARDSHALLDNLNSDIEPSDAAIEAFARYKRSAIERPVRD